MWVLKIKLDSAKQFVGQLAIKYKVSIASYNISYYKDKKWIYHKEKMPSLQMKMIITR